MSEIAKTFGVASGCALLLTLALGGLGCGGGGPPEPGDARKVQLFNCTHVNDPYGPPSGHSFKICTKVDGGGWVERGDLNTKSPGDWTDCEKDATEGGSLLTLNLLDEAGKWEIRAIKLPKGEEQSCDSSCDATGADACVALTYFFQSNVTAPEEPVKVHVTDVGR
jgi:hypothetical protein